MKVKSLWLCGKLHTHIFSSKSKIDAKSVTILEKTIKNTRRAEKLLGKSSIIEITDILDLKQEGSVTKRPFVEKSPDYKCEFIKFDSFMQSVGNTTKKQQEDESQISANDKKEFIPLNQMLEFEQKRKGPNSKWFEGFPWDDEIDVANREIFGNKDFRENQREIINATKSNRDVLALIPTGGGKSLTFQLSAMTEDGVSIVIMPLLSLIEDQMNQMEEIGVPCIFIHTYNDISVVFDQLINGNLTVKLLFITPEKISQNQQAKDLLLNLYNERKLMRFVIDEVHWVSNWGQDFRPDYVKLSQLKDTYPGIPILGLTATATNQVKADICKTLQIEESLCFQSSFNRPNLFYEVRAKQKKFFVSQIAEFIKTKYSNMSGIIYCLSKKECESLSKELSTTYRMKWNYFHAGLSVEKRKKIQKAWMQNEYYIIVATVAFGMGINKKDVRFVIHTSFPKSIEAYSQECGRAGRDSKPAHCLLFYSYMDRKMQDFFIMNPTTISTEERKEENIHNLYKMLDYLEEAVLWRRKLQLSLLGEDFRAKKCNNNWDNWKKNEDIDEMEMTSKAMKIIECIQSVGEGWATINQLITIVRGNSISSIPATWRSRASNTHGILSTLHEYEIK